MNPEAPPSHIDLTNLPSDYLERRTVLVLRTTEHNARRAESYLRSEYPARALLDECHRFIFFDLVDSARGDWNSLRRVWFFPWLEVQRDIDQALSHALFASYKALYDCCRRAIEVTLTAVYFTQEHVPAEEARGWLNSQQDTPMFSRTLEKLMLNERYRSVAGTCSWRTDLQQFYWRLCNIVHVRGSKASYQVMQPTHMTFSDVAMPEFTPTSLMDAIDTLVETIRHVATIIAIHNPILLVGLPMFDKFGLNPPMAGFFEEDQAARLHKLLLPSTVTAIDRLVREDKEVESLTAWVNDKPDISRDELDQQFKDQDELLGKHRENGEEDGR